MHFALLVIYRDVFVQVKKCVVLLQFIWC